MTESYEGLEGLAVTINDGTIDITASDDGINTAGEKMELNGGYIHILAGGDGVDSNGDLTINGGEKDNAIANFCEATDSEGNVIVSYTALKTYDCVIISTAEVESGATYTLTTSGTTTEVTAE